MANIDLGTTESVDSVLKSNCVLVETGGNVCRITVDDLMNSINAGDEMLLRQVAWGVPIKQNQSSQDWGVIGNTGLRDEYESRCGRYLVTNSGVAAKLSAVDSSVFADGTALDESKGHVMFIAPRLYYVVKQDAATGLDYLWLSQLPIGGHYIGDAANDEYICIGAYKGTMVGSSLVSRSGATPAGGKTIEQFWTAAQTNGKDWGLLNYDHRRFMAMLGLGHYGNPNIQACLGNGVGGEGSNNSTWSEASKLLVGATKSLGDALAKIDITPLTATDGTPQTINSCRVNMLGIEDPYGWEWEALQGIYCGSSDNSAHNGTEVFIYKGNRIPTAAELSSHPSGDYRQISRRLVSAAEERPIIHLLIGEYFDLIPTESNHQGGASSYWGDVENISSTGQSVGWGGATNGASGNGLFCSRTRGVFSTAETFYGSRLAYYGPLKFVSGKELI